VRRYAYRQPRLHSGYTTSTFNFVPLNLVAVNVRTVDILLTRRRRRGGGDRKFQPLLVFRLVMRNNLLFQGSKNQNSNQRSVPARVGRMPTAATATISFDPRSKPGTNRFLSGMYGVCVCVCVWAEGTELVVVVGERGFPLQPYDGCFCVCTHTEGQPAETDLMCCIHSYTHTQTHTNTHM
jgi:hypothetical protein